MVSHRFCGTVFLEPIIGTDSLNQWGPGVHPANCLYIREWVASKKTFVRANAPITCQMKVRDTIFSSPDNYSEQWGHSHKTDGLYEKMNKFTGLFDGELKKKEI